MRGITLASFKKSTCRFRAPTCRDLHPSVRRSKAMLLFAQPAVSRWLKVVHLMLDRLYCFEKSEDRFQIVVRHPAEVVPGHRRAQRSRANFSHAQRLDEGHVVVVTDSRSGRGYVCRNHVPFRFVKEKPSGEFHSRKWLTFLPWRVAINTSGHARDVSTA